MFFILAAVFLLANHAAYKGYFQDDDLDTLGWAQFGSSYHYLKALISPRLSPGNFRPAGHYYYHLFAVFYHLDFPKYIVPLHLIFLLNGWLLWMIARRLDFDRTAVFIGVVYYLFHAALLDAYWKPMYIFDLLCTVFCLASLLLWMHDRWLLSFVSFWLAYKSKELAIMLPALLAIYELTLGKKQWKKLVPFFMVSLAFGLQGLFANLKRNNEYTFQFNLRALTTSATFYSSKIFFAPLAGLVLVPLPFLVRDRRLWLGMAWAALFLSIPMVLPGRLFAVYWCLPLAGIALSLMAIVSHYRLAMVILLILWAPWDYLQVKRARSEILRLERANHAFVAGLERLALVAPGERIFVYDGMPEAFHPWGVAGAVTCVYRSIGHKVLSIYEPDALQLIATGNAAFLHWDPSKERLQGTPSTGSQTSTKR